MRKASRDESTEGAKSAGSAVKIRRLEREVAHLRAKAAELHELLSTDGCWEHVSLEDFLAKP